MMGVGKEPSEIFDAEDWVNVRLKFVDRPRCSRNSGVHLSGLFLQFGNVCICAYIIEEHIINKLL
jgi:hypothetical protein